ncbi:hypothetical protein [Macrococcus bovicus]|uniref:Uncharacterized protein n=1 Tax=Macrococcus bovicus TaxID=69968 RepID=A0A4R6C086_9STAP|nr:hypothetical protein [Macrococcus bovicus]TDM14399.1 hypothetical protein ERX55_05570 [Macrococcus bovicus]
MKVKIFIVLLSLCLLCASITSFSVSASEYPPKKIEYAPSAQLNVPTPVEPNTVEKMIGDKIIKDLKIEVVETSPNLLINSPEISLNTLSSSVPEKVVPSDGCGSTKTGYVNVSKSKIASLSSDTYTISAGVATYVIGAISTTVGYYVGAGLLAAWIGTKLYLAGYSGVRFYYEYGWQYYYNSGCYRYTLLTGWNRY